MSISRTASQKPSPTKQRAILPVIIQSAKAIRDNPLTVVAFLGAVGAAAAFTAGTILIPAMAVAAYHIGVYAGSFLLSLIAGGWFGRSRSSLLPAVDGHAQPVLQKRGKLATGAVVLLTAYSAFSVFVWVPALAIAACAAMCGIVGGALVGGVTLIISDFIKQCFGCCKPARTPDQWVKTAPSPTAYQRMSERLGAPQEEPVAVRPSDPGQAAGEGSVEIPVIEAVQQVAPIDVPRGSLPRPS